MKIDVTKPIFNYEGKEIKTEDNKSLTRRDIFGIALNNLAPNENLTAEDKSKIYQLSLKLFGSKIVDLSLDDRAFIKERAGKVLGSALTYGRICDLLESEDKK